jgi:HK97 family phage portal protein
VNPLRVIPVRQIRSGYHRIRSTWRRLLAATSDIRSPSAWLTDWSLGSSTTAGTYISPGSAMGLSAYYACLRAISEDVGKLPLNVYKSLDPRGKEIQRDHPAQAILHDEFNPTMGAMTARETMMHWALGWGKGCAEIVRDGSDKPRQAWPIHPDRITPVLLDGRLFYDIALQADGQGRTREAVRLPARDVLHIRGLGDNINGYSVAQTARESLGLTMGAQEFGSAFFGNDTTLGVYMVPAQKLGDTERADFKQQLQQAKGAPGEAFKFMVLPHGMEVKRLSIPPKDAQFLEVREFQVAEVARWFRMPPHKIQHLANATFSNIESQAIEYVGDTLMPWLVRCEQEYNRKLISAGRRRQLFTKHVVQALLRGDYATRTAGYLSLQRMGVLSQNDIRELLPTVADDPARGQRGAEAGAAAHAAAWVRASPA